MKFNNIQFPVYKLGTEKPQEINGVVFYQRSYKDKSKPDVFKIIDDRNQSGATLSLRRLKVLSLGGNLQKIDTAVFFLGDLIKLSNSRTWFIDSAGKYFIYTKSVTCKLKFRRIKAHIPIQGGHIIEVDGIESRFKTLYYSPEFKYAGVLEVNSGYILYGLYAEQPKDTIRKI